MKRFSQSLSDRIPKRNPTQSGQVKANCKIIEPKVRMGGQPKVINLKEMMVRTMRDKVRPCPLFLRAETVKALFIFRRIANCFRDKIL